MNEVEEAMAKLSIKKIEASVAGTPEKSVADGGEAEEEKLLVHDEMAASKHSLSSRRPERSVKEETHPTEEGEQEEEVKDPHEIGFMTPEEVEEYET